MTEQIAPCPFCGGEAGTDNITGSFYVECHNFDCDAVGPSKDTEAKAIAAWNRVAAAVKLAEAAGEWLREVEAVFGPQPDDWGLPSTIGTTRGPITVGMIRDAAPPAEKEDGDD